MEKSSQKKTFFIVALFATVICIGVQLYLNKHHVDLKLGISSAASICNINEKLNCDTAASSSYAELFGVPMALLGAFTAGLLLVLMTLARFNMTADTERTERYAFYLSTFMVLVSIVMGSISLFILNSACPFCIATYVLSVIIWFSLMAAYRPKCGLFVDDLKDAFTSEKWVLGVLISVPVLAFLVNSMVLDSYGYQEIKRLTQDSLNTWKNSPAQTFDVENGLSFQNGTGEVKVVIVEFADVLCPHCKAAAPNLHNFAKIHPDVKIVFKSFPLDGTCNAGIPQKGDGKRCDYAYATFCSEKLFKKGWDALNYFFDRQESLYTTPSNQIVESFCKDSNADCTALKACMAGDEVHDQVKRMAGEGEKAQIAGTPAVFFNSKSLNGGQLSPVLESTYREYNK